MAVFVFAAVLSLSLIVSGSQFANSETSLVGAKPNIFGPSPSAVQKITCPKCMTDSNGKCTRIARCRLSTTTRRPTTTTTQPPLTRPSTPDYYPVFDSSTLFPNQYEYHHQYQSLSDLSLYARVPHRRRHHHRHRGSENDIGTYIPDAKPE